ncbi:hypothetical protein SBOR_9628 [Sclerotinia borealis F-4128]|uniref:Uncharacterized protein n=1 Tax=Sclerotinia borealis (strain F-4128) TaxID=1432307 RepID=W9C5Y9_SCLBF|nr:hypothetical protein SBOR_9628 [Sclerotinia borealis F-4128]
MASSTGSETDTIFHIVFHYYDDTRLRLYYMSPYLDCTDERQSSSSIQSCFSKGEECRGMATFPGPAWVLILEKVTDHRIDELFICGTYTSVESVNRATRSLLAEKLPPGVQPEEKTRDDGILEFKIRDISNGIKWKARPTRRLWTHARLFYAQLAL